MTRRARATAANLIQQSRMKNKDSHSGFKEAARGGSIEKSMSIRKYQAIYQTAINNTTTDTNQRCSICHTTTVSSEDRYYVTTVGTEPVKRRQQQQSGCTHTNKAIDGTGANSQNPYSIIRNNSMIQQKSIISRYTCNYAADTYDSIDIIVLIPHESRGGNNMQQSVVKSHTSDLVGDTRTAMHSRYSVTLTAEKTDMRRQTQIDRSSEHSSAVHPDFIKAIQPSVATSLIKRAIADSIIISSDKSEEVQEQSATKFNNAAKSNNYRIMHMSKEVNMDKALKLQQSVNKASDQVAKISKSYLEEQNSCITQPSLLKRPPRHYHYSDLPQANSVITLPSDNKYTQFMHASFGSPVISTLTHAIRKGYLLSTIPRFTSALLLKHKPNIIMILPSV